MKPVGTIEDEIVYQMGSKSYIPVAQENDLDNHSNLQSNILYSKKL